MTDDEAKEISKNSSTGADVLASLALHENRWVRSNVAEHVNTSIDVLDMLSSDQDPVVIGSIIKNHATPTAALIRIVNNAVGTADVHKVLGRRTLDEALQHVLAGYPSEDVRASLAEHSSTKPDVLEQLYADDNRRIRDLIARNPNTKEYLLHELSKSYFFSVINNPSAPVEILRRAVSTDQGKEIYSKYVAQNPMCPDDILNDMSFFNKWVPHWRNKSADRADLVISMSLHSRLTDISFDRLRREPVDTRLNLIMNPTVKASHLVKLALTDKSDKVRTDAMQKIERSASIRNAVKAGELKLSDECFKDKARTLSLGDFLIENKMTDRYQQLLSAELESVLPKISLQTQHNDTPSIPLKRMRM